MSSETASRHRDPRTVLVQDKFFSLRPQPLEQWLWKQAIPAAAERVFWVHWEAGMRAGDWCSQIPIRLVAARCCLDPSTVTRAYQVLGRLGLLRREDPGRDPANPFQQATAVTEVRLPRELLVELDRAPNRAARRPEPTPQGRVPEPSHQPTSPAPATAPTPPPGHLKFRDYQRIQGKFSPAEKARYRAAWEQGRETMAFDPDSAVCAMEQAHICWQLYLKAKPPAPPATSISVPVPTARPGNGFVGPRRLTVLEAARLRRRISEVIAAPEVAEVFRQVLWSTEEGALRRFEVPLAANIALKKLREGAWTRPNRMPPNWLRAEVLRDARPESCVAA
jgi:hypothetical protein